MKLYLQSQSMTNHMENLHAEMFSPPSTGGKKHENI